VPDVNNLNIDVNKLTRRQKAQLKNQVNLDIDIEEPLLQLPDKVMFISFSNDEYSLEIKEKEK